MGILLKGKPVADKIESDLIAGINEYKTQGISPKIAIIRVGTRADDIAYEQRVIKNCERLGIAADAIQVDDNIIMEEFDDVLSKVNKDPETHGILIFRPLPAHLDADVISRRIDPLKDIDCMSPVNFEKVFVGDKTAIAPCTPLAVIEILKFYGYDIGNMQVAVVNRSMVLGKPLAMLFLAENATVTICHSKTQNLASLTAQADVVVTGVGKAEFFGPDYFSDKSVIIDVGINFKEGKICGDVDPQAGEKAAAITPVPGGVGSVTSMILLRNVLQAIGLQTGGPNG